MTAPRWLRAVLVLGLLGYLHQLAGLPPHAPAWVRNGVLGSVVLVLPVACLLRSVRAREDRYWPRLLAGGASALALAHLLRVLAGLTGPDGPIGPALAGHVASLADVVGLLAFPLLLAGLLRLLQPHLHKIQLIIALDGATGALAGAAFAGWAVGPLVSHADLHAPQTAALVVSALGDAALVATALGAVGVVGAQLRRPFVLVALGVVVLAIADISRAYQVLLGGYAVGSWLDGLVAVGLVLVAAGATSPPGTPAAREVPGPGSLGVTTVASVVAVVVLAASPGWDVAPVPTVLALLTLAGCGGRFLLVLWEIRELAVIRQQALTDELTGIANRRALYQHLDEMFLPAREEDAAQTAPGRAGTAADRVEEPAGPRPFALALIDLDHFKEVNDTLGHQAGDELLRAVVGRFSAALEELQTPHLLARLGGDEFAVVLHEAGSRNAALIVGEALKESLREPVTLDDAVLHAQASVGLALAPKHGDNRGDLMFAADAAMYAAKTAGTSVALHSPATVGDRRQRLEIAEDLFQALERHELTVVYQPIRTPERGLVAAEALVRWDHPVRGRVAPGEFLEAAERYRLTHEIARRVLEVSLGDLARWRDRAVPVGLSVNVSASDLRDETIVNLVAAALLEHQLPPEVLTIEITESAMMSDPDRSRAVMRDLDDLGVNLSVDDYGTGYSSLQYLLELPIDEIKLSRTFVASLAHEERARAIVASTIDLTHALGLRMVAEGVENVQTLTALQELGCDLVQGFHVGRPVPAEEFARLLAPSTAGRHRLPAPGLSPARPAPQ
ncbi:putative bifunctional diguanylate cyclase/phosphodiesterase [Nocardioides mesophilus]|uniref:Bifunctional diguanylate cyclase/phosphodiesterase n=1 Tax=Nocardioides mesophilus TaxID=433659 RepID=A0A7G9RDW3_9ACTN|nr:bifunctional diguanylate cyclase/phosphodiesterase [Nocardioides mesophilus]QNN53788.1 bifunctional diguanylate cyclase/phosphodiesterase [Nocardioides mesophilus]